MGKSLSDMTLQELWELFPIYLTEHNKNWSKWYTIEKNRITKFLKISDFKINHIGSTAIKDIWAKPIIDILVEIPTTISMEDVKNLIIKNNYICMSEDNMRKSFCSGYTEKGFAKKVFHLHLRYFNDNDELYFRDYMNDNKPLAKEYEKLKISLWKRFEHDRDGYTNAKKDFVLKYTKIAKTKYKNRY